MKTIGIIGGMSWESTLEYYRLINEGVRDRLGGLHSAKIALVSVDFAEIEPLQQAGAWDETARMLAAAGRQARAAGADFLVLATNTMHIVAAEIEAGAGVPLLHIADPTAAAVQSAGMKRIGLLGTRFTMEQDFYRRRLEAKGLEVLIPDAGGRADVHRIIYEELVLGVIREESRARYRQVIGDLAAGGAEGMILGCTEIGLLVKEEDSPVPLFDTTRIHAAAAVELALRD